MTALSAPSPRCSVAPTAAAPARVSPASSGTTAQPEGQGFAAKLDDARARASADDDVAAAESATAPAMKKGARAATADSTAAVDAATAIAPLPAPPVTAPAAANAATAVAAGAAGAAIDDAVAHAVAALEATTFAASARPTPGTTPQGTRRDGLPGDRASPDAAAPDVTAIDRRDEGPRGMAPPPPAATALTTAAEGRGAQAPGDNPSFASAAPGLALRELAPANTAASPPSTPFTAHLSAALDSPAFAPALATQVKWLVREGVQQAQLTLNPPEMGPLAVHIVLDGVQARVDFRADLAATRGAIEASLPTLAAALGDSGLTLSGSSVFDGQARHGPPGDRGQPAPSRGTADDAPQPATLAGAVPLTARGLVDLVA